MLAHDSSPQFITASSRRIYSTFWHLQPDYSNLRRNNKKLKLKTTAKTYTIQFFTANSLTPTKTLKNQPGNHLNFLQPYESSTHDNFPFPEMKMKIKMSTNLKSSPNHLLSIKTKCSDIKKIISSWHNRKTNKNCNKTCLALPPPS